MLVRSAVASRTYLKQPSRASRAGSHLRLLLEEVVLEIGNRIIQRRRDDLEAGTVKAPKH